jgi:hypothetical protein
MENENKTCGNCAHDTIANPNCEGTNCINTGYSLWQPKPAPENRVFTLEGYVLKTAFKLWPIEMNARGMCKLPMVFNLKPFENPTDFLKVKVTWEVL